MPLPQDPLKWAVTAFKDGRNSDYDRFADYMDGDQPLAFATEKFRSAFGRLFEAFAYNRCEMVVDAHADRMRVEGIGADDDALGTAAQELWDTNHMDLREGHAEVDAFGLGDSFVYVEMNPEPGRGVQMWVQDPRNMRVHYSSEVPGEIDLAAKAWVDPETEHARLNLYFANRVEKYVSQNRAPAGIPNHSTAFKKYQKGDDGDFRLNVATRVPIFHFANNGRTNTYGRSEIRHVIALQDAVNKTLMDMLVAMEFAAYPQRVLTGVQAPTTPEELAIWNAFQAGVNRILTLDAPDAKVAEFSAVNMAQYLSIAEFWDKAISRVTKVPQHYLGMTGDFPSGRALRIAEAPFIAKLEDRTRHFGHVWTQVVAYGLNLNGMTQVTPGDLRINWASVAPLSDEDQMDIALQKEAIGFPFETLLRELGYEPEQIETILSERDAMVQQAQRAFDRGAVVPDIDDEDEVA